MDKGRTRDGQGTDKGQTRDGQGTDKGRTMDVQGTDEGRTDRLSPGGACFAVPKKTIICKRGREGWMTHHPFHKHLNQAHPTDQPGCGLQIVGLLYYIGVYKISLGKQIINKLGNTLINRCSKMAQ